MTRYWVSERETIIRAACDQSGVAWIALAAGIFAVILLYALLLEIPPCSRNRIHLAAHLLLLTSQGQWRENHARAVSEYSSQDSPGPSCVWAYQPPLTLSD